MSPVDLSSSSVSDERFRLERVDDDLSFFDEVVLPPFAELRPDEDLFDDPEELPLFEFLPFIKIGFTFCLNVNASTGVGFLWMHPCMVWRISL